jgi:hypothetical protein
MSSKSGMQPLPQPLKHLQIQGGYIVVAETEQVNVIQAAAPAENDDLRDYRKILVAAEQKSQEDYDKTVITLSGGALGVSFAFVDKFLTPGKISAPNLLFCAWFFWITSLTAVLVSYYFSHLALRHAIVEVDKGEPEKIHSKFNSMTKFCNAIGGIAFIVGLIMMAIFVVKNFGA